MSAAAPALQAVLALADLDTRLDQAAHKVAHLPEAAAVAAIDAEAAAVTARRAAAAVTLEEVAGRQAHLEDDLAATEARISAVSVRLYGGEVTAARDLQAMTADLEGLRARASELEDRVLAVLDEREPLDAVISAADTELAALVGRRAEATVALAAAAGDVQGELDDLRARRAEVAAEVGEDLRARYDKIRARVGGAGAARLVGDRCGGCHLTLPSMELDSLRRASPPARGLCEEGGRILVRTS